jgi:EPS-associated MarR family transcriptional regulator
MTKSVSEDVQFRVLWLLETQPNMSQREIAAELALSVGGINYCLKALVQKGQVKVRNFRRSNNKLGYAYILTPSGLEKKSRMTASFLRRKLAEYERLKQEIEALERDLGLSN